MKLHYESRYMIVKGNYLFLNNSETHLKWVKFNISTLSKREKKKICMGIINKSIHYKLWTAPCLIGAKHEHP